MGVLQKTAGRFPVGVWLALVALLSLCLAWAMQFYSLLDWNSAVDLGLQNESFDGNPAERAWALEGWGVAMADMLWAMPITVVAFFGIVRVRLFGFVSGMLAFAVGVYFPLVFAFSQRCWFDG